MDIVSLVETAQSRKASDLHLAVASPPALRVHGQMEYTGDSPLSEDDMKRIFEQITMEKDRETFNRDMELDFCYSVNSQTRLRCNAAIQRGGLALAIRLIPIDIPAIDTLGLPGLCKDLVTRPRGLIVVSGATGNGKSTTLAALIDYLNHTRNLRVVTIEDPIEYVYTSNKSTILQRELGSDTHSFASALKHVLRQDPDLILVGEMRDYETAAAVLQIAETGHLVLTTGHAPSSYQAVERIIDLFPVHERGYAQTRLASLLIGIICQVLVPTVDKKGRLPAVELMLANTAVNNLIREGKIHQLANVLRTHRSEGMQTIDQALITLLAENKIDEKTLYAHCQDRAEVEKILRDMDAPREKPKQAVDFYTYLSEQADTLPIRPDNIQNN